jgi:hypothetical protein
MKKLLLLALIVFAAGQLSAQQFTAPQLKLSPQSSGSWSAPEYSFKIDTSFNSTFKGDPNHQLLAQIELPTSSNSNPGLVRNIYSRMPVARLNSSDRMPGSHLLASQSNDHMPTLHVNIIPLDASGTVLKKQSDAIAPIGK